MKTVIYKGNHYRCRDDETLLEAFQRQGAEVQFSCRYGVCHTCMLRSESGSLPQEAQRGINQELQDKGYFLPCKCHPVDDMRIADPLKSDLFIDAVIVEKTMLTEDIVRILLEPMKNFSYRAGQFINLRHPDGTVRSYSLASTAEEDYLLELQIRRQPEGKVSVWLCDSITVGETVSIQGPEGECYYREDSLTKPLLLIGAGTGLAPLVGIVREALAMNMAEEIHLYHGDRHHCDLYLHDFLNELAERHPQFHYTACLSIEQPLQAGILPGRVNDIALSRHPDLVDSTIYLAGSPKMVEATKAALELKGLTGQNIYSDPFIMSNHETSVPNPVPNNKSQEDKRSSPTFEPNQELCLALEEGSLVSRILNDFYSQVFEDPRLAPFFHGVTQQRLEEKQFLFMRQLITGEKIYFGDRPRNAHHWMVISDELFDYREKLMLDTLRRHGLPEPMVQQWRALEEQFRCDIVKEEPWKKKMGEIEFPLDGYGETVLDVGSICDSCGGEVDVGVKVRYHLRLGSLYCPDCMTDSDQTEGQSNSLIF